MSKNHLPPKRPNSFLRYSNLAIQMGLIIGLFTWAGYKLDTYYQNKEPYLTIALSLIGIGASLYLVIRDLMKNSGTDDNK
jgi:F0F1-type ATP synthase assembly protein I